MIQNTGQSESHADQPARMDAFAGTKPLDQALRAELGDFVVAPNIAHNPDLVQFMVSNKTKEVSIPPIITRDKCLLPHSYVPYNVCQETPIFCLVTFRMPRRISVGNPLTVVFSTVEIIGVSDRKFSSSAGIDAGKIFSMPPAQLSVMMQSEDTQRLLALNGGLEADEALDRAMLELEYNVDDGQSIVAPTPSTEGQRKSDIRALPASDSVERKSGAKTTRDEESEDNTGSCQMFNQNQNQKHAAPKKQKSES
jgi:hypothetical protein